MEMIKTAFRLDAETLRSLKILYKKMGYENISQYIRFLLRRGLARDAQALKRK